VERAISLLRRFGIHIEREGLLYRSSGGMLTEREVLQCAKFTSDSAMFGARRALVAFSRWCAVGTALALCGALAVHPTAAWIVPAIVLAMLAACWGFFWLMRRWHDRQWEGVPPLPIAPGGD
jgi:hypothetical protein